MKHLNELYYHVCFSLNAVGMMVERGAEKLNKQGTYIYIFKSTISYLDKQIFDSIQMDDDSAESHDLPFNIPRRCCKWHASECIRLLVQMVSSSICPQLTDPAQARAGHVAAGLGHAWLSGGLWQGGKGQQ